jgi:hypothetical protein
VCQDKDLKLQCGNSETENNDTRIAIYSSSFSASGGTHIYCPSEGKKDFDSAFDQQACEEQYVTEPVMKLCHGQRKFFFCFKKDIFFDLLSCSTGSITSSLQIFGAKSNNSRNNKSVFFGFLSRLVSFLWTRLTKQENSNSITLC